MHACDHSGSLEENQRTPDYPGMGFCPERFDTTAVMDTHSINRSRTYPFAQRLLRSGSGI